MKVLIAEDEAAISRILTANLSKAGYHPIVVDDGQAVIAVFEREQPDIVLLDVLLPGLDGFELCQLIRQRSDVPIIMVTASRTEAERLRGFSLGADDYVCKPFSPSEVVARVRSLLRRAQPRVKETGRVLVLGSLKIWAETLEVSLDEIPVELTGTEFKLLLHLAKSANRIYSRDQLLDILQGDSCEKSDRTVDSHIRNLRRKLGTNRPDLVLIQSVYGEGYRLIYPFQAGRSV